MRLVPTRRSFLAGTTAMAGVGIGLGRTRLARAATPLTMQAAWINDAEFMGYFVAIDEG